MKSLFVVLIVISFNTLQLTAQSPSALYSSTKYQSDYLDINSVCNAIKTRITDIIPFEYLYLWSHNIETNEVELLLSKTNSVNKELSNNQLLEISQTTDVKSTSLVHQNQEYAMLSAPFINQEGQFAYICLIRIATQPFTKADINLMELFVQRYSMGLSYAITFKKLSEYKGSLEEKVNQRTKDLEYANKEKNKLLIKLKEQAQKDGLTKLNNRRTFDSDFDNLTKNPPKSLSLAIFDLDFFKKVNDDYGHEIGDSVLIAFAKLLIDNSKAHIKSYRYGGEEFVLLIENYSVQECLIICEGIRNQVENHHWQAIEKNLSITVSAGLAHYPGIEPNHLFSHADKMLYLAKNKGRNRLEF